MSVVFYFIRHLSTPENLGQNNLLRVGSLNYSQLETVPGTQQILIKQFLTEKKMGKKKSVILKSITNYHGNHISKLWPLNVLLQIFIFTSNLSSKLFVHFPLHVLSSHRSLIDLALFQHPPNLPSWTNKLVNL